MSRYLKDASGGQERNQILMDNYHMILGKKATEICPCCLKQILGHTIT